MLRVAIAAIALVAPLPAFAATLLTNGGFEAPSSGTVPSSQQRDASLVPGWSTTAADNLIEIWAGGFLGVTAYEEAQSAEVNARAAALYRDVSGVAAGAEMQFEFAHRGRSGTDTLRLTITDLGSDGVFETGDDTSRFTSTFSTGMTAGSFYDGTALAPIYTLGNDLRFSCSAVSSAGERCVYREFPGRRVLQRPPGTRPHAWRGPPAADGHRCPVPRPQALRLIEATSQATAALRTGERSKRWVRWPGVRV